MTHSPPEILDARRALKRQVPAFLVIGTFGFCLDAAITILLVKGVGVSPLLARPPAFAIVTLINFALNRLFTFGAGEASWLRALARYVLVCLGGLVVNYAIYAGCLALADARGWALSPALLTLFVAAGTGTAMVVTFAGFRGYAFRR
jgi:putative flippase GtrA